jgi:hypothetical protein
MAAKAWLLPPSNKVKNNATRRQAGVDKKNFAVIIFYLSK